jgi:tripartite-type tricarboxylate transporter receptor subunit TctC
MQHLISITKLCRRAFGAFVALSIAFALSWFGGVAAAPATYAGKQIVMMVGQPPGGAYDAYARLFGQYLPKYLPGKPRVIIENMPGAGGVTMANYLFNEAPKDGTVIGLGAGIVSTADLFKIAGARFDPNQFGWIGSMDSEIGEAISWRTSPIKTAQDLFSRELVVAGTGAASNSVIFPRAMNRVLGAKFKIIPGYHGSGEMALALQRGEVQGIGAVNYSDLAETRPDWIKDHKVNFLLQLGLNRHPDLPDVPTALDVSHTNEQRQLLQLIFAQQAIGRPIFAPPVIDPEKLQLLDDAFKAVMNDPDFVHGARVAGLQIIDPMDGPTAKQFIKKLYELPAPIVAKAAAAISSVD